MEFYITETFTLLKEETYHSKIKFIPFYSKLKMNKCFSEFPLMNKKQYRKKGIHFY